MVRGFAFEQPSPLADKVRNAPGASQCPACADLKGGLLFAGQGGMPRSLFDPDRNNLQPRVGFAYSVNPKTVIRGGYGLYYQYRNQFGSQTGFFVDTPYIANDITGRVGVPELGLNTFSNPFPNGLIAAPGSSQGLLTQVGQGISFDDPTNRVPHIHAFNLTVGRQIARDLMVEVSYVGSRIRDLAVARSINDISAADLARGATYLQERVPNPFAGLLPGSSFNGPTVQRQLLLRPYPQFGGVTETSMSIGKTWYNAIQVIVQKRMSHGLKFTSSYTYSRTREKNSFLNSQDTELVEQPTDYDRPHVWVFSGTYELPFGKGRRFGGEARGLRQVLIGGWQPFSRGGRSTSPAAWSRSPRPGSTIPRRTAGSTPATWTSAAWPRSAWPTRRRSGASARHSHCAPRPAVSRTSACPGSPRSTPPCSRTSSSTIATGCNCGSRPSTPSTR
jgi:hypothetical protein